MVNLDIGDHVKLQNVEKLSNTPKQFTRMAASLTIKAV